MLEPYRSDIAGLVVESTYNWYWLVDGLMESGFKVHLANTAKRYYQRKMAKTNRVVAVKTVAHKLARACFYVLKDQTEFDVQKAFA